MEGLGTGRGVRHEFPNRQRSILSTALELPNEGNVISGDIQVRWDYHIQQRGNFTFL